MVADLVVVAVLLALLGRISRGALLGWLKSVRVPWAAFPRSRYFRPLLAIVAIALCSWAQAVVMLGAETTVATAWSGTPPGEIEQCFRVQRNVLANAAHSESRDLRGRCPSGGGDFDLSGKGECPAHGRVSWP